MTTRKTSLIAIAVFIVLLLTGFIIGIINPLAMFMYVVSVLMGGVTFLMLVFLCAILYNLFRLIVPRQNRPWSRLAMYFCFLLAGFFMIAILPRIGFEGLNLHYKIVRCDFESARAWAKSVPFDKYGAYSESGSGIPALPSRFSPMYVSVYPISKTDSRRILDFRWGSGISEIDYDLIIMPSDTDYNDDDILIKRKLAPGVYLTFHQGG
jgi:hypothetical protein